MDDAFKKRLYSYTLKLVAFVEKLPNDIVGRRTGDQLFRSGTSIMANIVEAKGASTRKEYRNFFSIALKSANETHFWFCLLRDSKKVKSSDLEWFIQETDEICKMLGKSVVNLAKEKK